MGASDFSTIGRGPTADAAFNAAVDHARYEHGHGGYTGTIAEKHSFVVFTPPNGVTAKEFAHWALYGHGVKDVELPDATRADFGKPGGPTKALGSNPTRFYRRERTPIPPEHTALVEKAAAVADDKWGPAVAVKLDADKWLFFGLASD